MTWSDVKKTLTLPPPPRTPPPKHPLFTKDFFSTKSFGPGHLVGAGILVFAAVGVTKYVRTRLAEQPRPPGRLEDESKVAQAENQRGQYGKKP